MVLYRPDDFPVTKSSVFTLWECFHYYHYMNNNFWWANLSQWNDIWSQCYTFSLHSTSWISISQIKPHKEVTNTQTKIIVSRVKNERKIGFTSIGILQWQWGIQNYWRRMPCPSDLTSWLTWMLWWCMLRFGGETPVYWELTILLHNLSISDPITAIFNIICMYLQNKSQKINAK